MLAHWKDLEVIDFFAREDDELGFRPVLTAVEIQEKAFRDDPHGGKFSWLNPNSATLMPDHGSITLTNPDANVRLGRAVNATPYK